MNSFFVSIYLFSSIAGPPPLSPASLSSVPLCQLSSLFLLSGVSSVFHHYSLFFFCVFTFASCLSFSSFWLFYGVHLLEDRTKIAYKDIVQFALSLIDALLFVHYLAILLLELRHLSPQYCVKVVRSPDGQSATFPLGNLSVQRAAAHVLEKYYVEFPVYNPYLETLPGTKGKKGASSYKVYDIDGGANDGNSTVVSQMSKGRGHSSHNERYYEEDDYERKVRITILTITITNSNDHQLKVRKRRARLLTAAEESFTHIRRMRWEHFFSF